VAEVDANLASRLATPAGFAQVMSGGRYVPAPHHILMSEWAADCFYGRRKQVVMNIPPQHGKSELISVHVPAWAACLDPDSPNILTGYGADLVHGFSRRARDLAAAAGEQFFGLKLDKSSAAVDEWRFEGHPTGGWIAAGISGPIAGRGAGRLFILDDAIKNPQEAFSQVYHKNFWDWWQYVVLERVWPQASKLVIMTRWALDDPAGRLLEEGGWDLLRLPALAEENDPLGRKPGEGLWPWRFKTEDYIRLRDGDGDSPGMLPEAWAAQYQQAPLPPGGGLFKREWFRYFTFEPAPEVGVQSWQEQFGTYILTTSEGEKRWPSDKVWRFSVCDPAWTTKTTSDWFVLLTCGVTSDADLLLLDVVRVRVRGPEGEDLVAQDYAKWRPAYEGMEEVSVGQDILARLVRRGLPMRPLKPGHRDPRTRALTAASRYQSGSIYHRAGALWLNEWERELLAFGPGCEYDDQVATISYAALELYQPEGPPPPKKPEVARMIDEILAKQQQAQEGENWL